MPDLVFRVTATGAGGVVSAPFEITVPVSSTAVTSPTGNLLTANQWGLETDLTGWVAGANSSILRTTTAPLTGAASLQMTHSGVAARFNDFRTPSSHWAVVTERASYALSVKARTTAATASPYFIINWYASATSTTPISQSALTENPTTFGTSTTSLVSTGEPAPVGATRAEIVVGADVGSAGAVTIWDEFAFLKTADAPPATDPAPAPTGVRVPLWHPFPSNDYPNIAVGANATFAVTTATTRLRDTLNYVNFNNGFSYTVRQARTTDPFCTIHDHQHASRSTTGYVPDGTPIPRGMLDITGHRYDCPVLILQPSGRWITIYGAEQVARDRWEGFRVEDVDTYGSGIHPGHSIGSRADGLADAWGLIREDHMRTGRIDHVLAIAGAQVGMLSGYRWPAVTEDGHGYPPGGSYRMGTKYGYPVGTVKPSNLSPCGSVVWDAIYNYGCQIRDEAGEHNAVFYAEQSSNGTFVGWVDGLIHDLALGRIANQLQEITNNNNGDASTPAWYPAAQSDPNVGAGGGAPRVARLANQQSAPLA